MYLFTSKILNKRHYHKYFIELACSARVGEHLCHSARVHDGLMMVRSMMVRSIFLQCGPHTSSIRSITEPLTNNNTNNNLLLALLETDRSEVRTETIGNISTKTEPIRTLGSTSRLTCHMLTVSHYSADQPRLFSINLYEVIVDEANGRIIYHLTDIEINYLF